MAWLASRLFVTALGVIASTTLGRAEIGLDQAVPRALNLLGSWDTTWYLDIARRGYAFDVGQVGEVFTNVAFFPLMPIVMWAALAVGLNPFWVALLVSNAMFLVALVALYHLTRERFGQAMAVRATWVLALAPPAVAASMAYTEGLALGLAVLAGYLAWKGRFGWAGSVAAIAVLTRPTGVLAVVPVVMLAWYATGPGRRERLLKAVVPAGVVMGEIPTPVTWPVATVVRVVQGGGEDGSGVAAEMDEDPS
ncbi:MAG: glycosyltransferase family 39 protein [Miltoncostaeaceae bacterium]